MPLNRPCVESYFSEVGQVVGGNDVADGDDLDVLADEPLLREPEKPVGRSGRNR